MSTWPARDGLNNDTTRRPSGNCFGRAGDIARAQQADLLELRAAVSLSRLWSSQGKPEEARRLWAEVVIIPKELGGS